MSNIVRLTPRPDHTTGDSATERTGPTPPPGRAVYTVKEVAHMLALNLGSTYKLIRSGNIPAIKLGGRWAIPRHRFHVWLDNLPEDTTGAGADHDPAEVAQVHDEVRRTLTARSQQHGQ